MVFLAAHTAISSCKHCISDCRQCHFQLQKVSMSQNAVSICRQCISICTLQFPAAHNASIHPAADTTSQNAVSSCISNCSQINSRHCISNCNLKFPAADNASSSCRHYISNCSHSNSRHCISNSQRCNFHVQTLHRHCIFNRTLQFPVFNQCSFQLQIMYLKLQVPAAITVSLTPVSSCKHCTSNSRHCSLQL